MNHAETILRFPAVYTQLRIKHKDIGHDVSGVVAAIIWKQMPARINNLFPTVKCGQAIRIVVKRL